MKHLIPAAIAAAALSMTAAAASAGTLTNVSVTLSDNRVSQPTDVTIRFTTATVLTGGAIPFAGNSLFVTSGMGGLDLVAGPCGSDIVVRIDGAVLPGSALEDCQISPVSLWVQIQLKHGTTVAAGSNVEIVIDRSRATTSATGGVYSTNIFRTATQGGIIIDAPATEPTYTVVAPAPVPTLTEWAMIGLSAALAGFAALTLQRRRRLA
ncbi:IPTL-CTERM sorting domain-containing protein [Brevundimonas staleyi]|uniref:IPTL-CTERM sorting domain-containing protein n=1 Tax=Brevundimonas staleyi TaxID=74326 RepID=A0ABW0FTS2_9CAUL